MYTEIYVNAVVKDDPELISVIRYMLGQDVDTPKLPDHALFQTERWGYMLTCSSYYFTPKSVGILEQDEITGKWSLISVSSFKNYDGEVERFFDWIAPHVDHAGRTMIGYSRYEEGDEPTIYYAG